MKKNIKLFLKKLLSSNLDVLFSSKLEDSHEKKKEASNNYSSVANTIEWDLKDLNKYILRDLLHTITLGILTEHRAELQIEKTIEE